MVRDFSDKNNIEISEEEADELLKPTADEGSIETPQHSPYPDPKSEDVPERAAEIADMMAVENRAGGLMDWEEYRYEFFLKPKNKAAAEASEVITTSNGEVATTEGVGEVATTLQAKVVTVTQEAYDKIQVIATTEEQDVLTESVAGIGIPMEEDGPLTPPSTDESAKDEYQAVMNAKQRRKESRRAAREEERRKALEESKEEEGPAAKQPDLREHLGAKAKSPEKQDLRKQAIAERQAPQTKVRPEESSDDEEFTVDPDEACYDLYVRDIPPQKMYKYRYTSSRKFQAYLAERFPQVGNKCNRLQVECADLKRSFPCEVYCDKYAFDAVNTLWKEHLASFCQIHRPLETIQPEDRPAYLDYLRMVDDKIKARRAAAQAAELASQEAAEKASQEAKAQAKKEKTAAKRKNEEESDSDDEDTKSETELMEFFSELMISYKDPKSNFKAMLRKRQKPVKVSFVLRMKEAYLPMPILEGGRARGYLLRAPTAHTFYTGDVKRLDLGIIVHFPEDTAMVITSLQGRTPQFFNVSPTFIVAKDKEDGFNHLMVDVMYVRKLPDMLVMEQGLIIAALMMVPTIPFAMESVYSMNTLTHEMQSHEEAMRNAIPAGHPDDPAMKEADPEDSESGETKGMTVVYYNKAAVVSQSALEKCGKWQEGTVTASKPEDKAATASKSDEKPKKKVTAEELSRANPTQQSSTYAHAVQGLAQQAQAQNGYPVYVPPHGGSRYNGRAENWAQQDRRGGQGGGGWGGMPPPTYRNRREQLEALNRARSEKLQKYAARKWIPAE
jgi:hypothetical protein